MPFNGLSAEFNLKLGPVVLETLVKHCLERLKKSSRDPTSTGLKQEELLYHAAFNLAREFMKSTVYHSVEEIQAYTNAHTPSLPWTRIVRITIPMASCDKAAPYLIQALGGEQHARAVVGGVKWWQVRSLDGIEAQWITSKENWREAKKRYKMQQTTEIGNATSSASETGDCHRHGAAMDNMRCILFLHGGGYFCGSVDLERYSIERYARKINGRALAINYRLAPQYPFPCALHDALAAYLYLVDPPPESEHRPISPAHIIIAGDSAGGGLALALLQVLRDTDLPLPAGGVLISPWCDMTHSFPSIHTNANTDYMPEWGLTQMKPSILWPPPTSERSRLAQESFRTRVRQTFGQEAVNPSTSSVHTIHATRGRVSENVLPTTPVPLLKNETIMLRTDRGEELMINNQVQMYTQNSLMAHPLVSPALSYLGGLPPLLFIAGDGEVLRDEIIYAAHKAANPSRYPIHSAARELYLPLRGIEEKHLPSKVHLQVYDDVAHVLPVAFFFTTPAKYCFRAIATFTKRVTSMGPGQCYPPPAPASIPDTIPTSHDTSEKHAATSVSGEDSVKPAQGTAGQEIKGTLSARMQQVANAVQDKGKSYAMMTVPEGEGSAQVNLVPRIDSERYAGDSVVYESSQLLWPEYMIRERISTRGIIRPLEPESDLIACSMPEGTVGYLSEQAIRRYLDGATLFHRKFSRQAKAVEKRRHINLERAEKWFSRSFQGTAAKQSGHKTDTAVSLTITNKRVAWTLDGREEPPPSSIVTRIDTKEGQKLAEIVGKSLVQGERFNLCNFFVDPPQPAKRKSSRSDA